MRGLIEWCVKNAFEAYLVIVAIACSYVDLYLGQRPAAIAMIATVTIALPLGKVLMSRMLARRRRWIPALAGAVRHSLWRSNGEKMLSAALGPFQDILGVRVASAAQRYFRVCGLYLAHTREVERAAQSLEREIRRALYALGQEGEEARVVALLPLLCRGAGYYEVVDRLQLLEQSKESVWSLISQSFETRSAREPSKKRIALHA